MDLRYGIADENVQKRSIRDVILRERQQYEKVLPDGGHAPLRDRTCSAIVPLSFSLRAGELAVINCLNRLAAGGIRAVHFSPVILLPPGTQEDVLRGLVRQICRAAFPHGVRIGDVHAEVTDAVTRPVVVGSAEGVPLCAPAGCSPEEAEVKVEVKEGWDIVLMGPVGMEGTYILVSEYMELLQKRFPIPFLMRMAGLCSELCILDAAQAACLAASTEQGAPDDQRDGWRDRRAGRLDPEEACPTGKGDTPRACPGVEMVSLGEGGFFAGLWELSRRTGCGLEADLQAVPLLQETVEITNELGINPYAMRSAGSLLIAAKSGEGIVQRLWEAGRTAVRIGTLTGGREKVLRNGEERRYLDRPQTDALSAWMHDYRKNA